MCITALAGQLEWPVDSKSDAKPSLSILLQLLGYLSPYKSRLLGAAAALLFTAGATLSLGKGVQVLIDRGFGSGNPAELKIAMALLLVIGVAMAVGTFVRFYLVSWLGERVSADLRRAVFNNIIHLEPGYFETNRSGEIMSRLTTDTSLLQTIIGSSLSMALRSSLTLCGALILMIVTNLKLSMAILVGVPLILLPILFYGKRVRKLSTRSQDSLAHVGSYAGEIIQHIKTVQSYTREEGEKQAFSAEVEAAFGVARKRVWQRALLIGAAMILLFAGLSALLWQGGQDVMSGNMSAGELGAFVFYAMMVGSGLATVSEVWGELQRAAGATERLLELIETRSSLSEPATQETTGWDKAAGQGTSTRPELHLEQLTFFYPTRPKQAAITALSLHIEAGKSLALVGPSGAGKSTIFELLQRFHDPQQGRVLLNMTDVRQINTQELRQHMALVPQQPALFTADVSYNIAYGRPSASQQEIETAARAAHAHDFITNLPAGYDSHLGEQGVRLSGGQKQRIALARAILNDPDILLLDEATSALDAESEHQVQLALQTLMQNRTTVIIAHRLSTILHVDRIAVLDQGELIATGTHHSLLEDCALYRRLAELQFNEENRLAK